MTSSQMIRRAIAAKPIDTNGHLNRAAICLYRADHLHNGYLRNGYLEHAAQHLRLAGQEALANQVEDDRDLRGAEDAVRALLDGK